MLLLADVLGVAGIDIARSVNAASSLGPSVGHELGSVVGRSTNCWTQAAEKRCLLVVLQGGPAEWGACAGRKFPGPCGSLCRL